MNGSIRYAGTSFLTLEDALLAARQNGEKRPRLTLEGKLSLAAPIRLTRALCPWGFVLTGADGAEISGGKALTGFHSVETRPEGELYALSLPEVDRVRHLYLDGVSAPRPRTEPVASSAWSNLEGGGFSFWDKLSELRLHESLVLSEYRGLETDHLEIASWRNTEDIEMVFETGWTHCVVPLRAVTPTERGTLTLLPEPVSFRCCQLKDGVEIGPCPNWFENVFEQLHTPGQWYFDRRERTLYLLLAPGDAPERHTVVLPTVESLLEVDGTLDEKLGGITFRNITFCDTDHLAPAVTGHPELQANLLVAPSALGKRIPMESVHKTPSALSVRAARGVRFDGCVFTRLGCNALDFYYGAEDCAVRRCLFHDIDGSAVIVGGFNLTDAHPADRRETVRGIQVQNCYIHHTGTAYKGSVAVCVGYAQDVSVCHNEICHIPYSAVSVGWGWAQADMTLDDRAVNPAPPEFPRWTEPSTAKRNHVDYNHIHHVMERLHDGSAIYTLGVMEGTSILGNLIHDSAGYTGDGYPEFAVGGIQVTMDPAVEALLWVQGFPGGIYMDQGSVGMEVSGNILYHVAVPFYYHNQIRDGWKKVLVRDNTVNLKPGDPGYPEDAAALAGPESEDGEA